MDLNSNFVVLNDIEKAKWMLLQKDLVMLASLGTYISCCFEKRNNTVKCTFQAVGVHNLTYMSTVHYMFSCLRMSCDLCVYLLFCFAFFQSNVCRFYIPVRVLFLI